MQLQETGVGARDLLFQLLVLLEQVGGNLLIGTIHLGVGSHVAGCHLLDDLRIAVLVRNLHLLHRDVFCGVGSQR